MRGIRSRWKPTFIGRATSACSSLAHMAARSKAGVEVKLLLDAVGSSTIGRDILQVLQRRRMQIGMVQPRPPDDDRAVQPSQSSKVSDRRWTRRLYGGAGIADHWRGHAQDEKHWRDIQVRVEGPASGEAANRIHSQLADHDRRIDQRRRLFSAGGFGRHIRRSNRSEFARRWSVSARILFYLAIACARQSDIYRESVFRAGRNGNESSNGGGRARC